MAKKNEAIGIALGSGGARGLAHVGVLEVLLERGVKPEFVAGTSMGALVGAAYAAGRFDALREAVAGLDVADAASLFIDFEIGGAGLVKGEKVMAFFEKIVPDAPIESLPIPFAAMATDIATGEAFLMSRGRLHHALRASISIPGVFTPVRRGNRLLVDGGVSSPVPVEAARDLGARRVLAVNVDGGPPCPYSTHRLPTVVNKAIGLGERVRDKIREELGRRTKPTRMGLVEMLMKTTRICEDRIAQWEIERSAPDWLLQPAVGDIPTLDFSRIDDAIQAGRDAASALVDADDSNSLFIN
ncbi:MAG: patatin-like phospholipase family protein [Kiritimatiellae bacterium]|nr:patatin-like phospholipase family protein [Kiritimatiellia bacterium]